MLRRSHKLSGRYQDAEPNQDDLVLRIRRLVQHRAFDHAKIVSPLLKRLTPNRPGYGQPFPDADLRRRMQAASLDRNAVSYLMMSVEAELDFAHQRLTDG